MVNLNTIIHSREGFTKSYFPFIHKKHSTEQSYLFPRHAGFCLVLSSVKFYSFVNFFLDFHNFSVFTFPLLEFSHDNNVKHPPSSYGSIAIFKWRVIGLWLRLSKCKMLVREGCLNLGFPCNVIFNFCFWGVNDDLSS